MDIEIDSKDLHRARWIVVDLPCQQEISFDSDPPVATYSNVSYRLGPLNVKPHAVVLKRLLKPCYRKEEQPIFTYGTRSIMTDRNVYVDMADKTMWLADSEPILLEDFHERIVSNDLSSNGVLEDGYELDVKPSTGLVSLFDLKESFVSWFCR